MTEIISDHRSLADRIESLERQNRVIKALGVLSIALLAGLGFGLARGAGAGSVETRHGGDEELTTGRFASLMTQDFQLIDNQGKLRASLGLSSEDHSDLRPISLRLYDEAGESGASLDAGGTFGPALDVYKRGVGSVRVSINGDSPLVQLSDDKGRISAVLWFMYGSPHLVLTDKRGRTRAVFGYESAWPSGPDRPRKTPSVMAIYDEKGKVVWSATQEESTQH